MARFGTFTRLLGLDRPPHRHDHWWHEHRRRLLPSYREDSFVSAIPAETVTEIALRIRHLIEKCVPLELPVDHITSPNSKIITKKVLKAAKEAGGKHHRSCVVYCLLVNKRWWKHQAEVELWDADLHALRAVACEVIAKQIIETEDDMNFLLHQVLLKRYSIMIDNKPTKPSNVVEKAVDLHALRVIGSSGYQKCINYLWRGWLVQDENDPATFVEYRDKDNTSFWSHLDPDRMRAPMYQNWTQMLISFIYLVLYTLAMNSVNPGGHIDVIEGLLYAFTLGFMCDEFAKIWKAGFAIIDFWSAFNSILYGLLTTSLVFRFIAFSHPGSDGDWRHHYNTLSYNFLAVSAPMFWLRLLLYLDSFRFFGAMLVVLKVMMKESIIFFALLTVIIIGFLQAFLGLDQADDQVVEDAMFIIQSMANALMQSPDFSGFERFNHPFGLLLYYCFTFVVMVILLNILIALYNSAYEDIYDNANDEYLAMFAQKTMQFVRAPDENVFIPPFNLIEIFLLALPLEWWMDKKMYERINDWCMATIYSPLLLVSAFIEVRTAQEIRANRARGDGDDDSVEEWEQRMGELDWEADGWAERVEGAKSQMVKMQEMEEDEEENGENGGITRGEVADAEVEIGKLREEVRELKGLVGELVGMLKEGREGKGKGRQVEEKQAEEGEKGVEEEEIEVEEEKNVQEEKVVGGGDGAGSSSRSSSSSDKE
ncbi:hypothetical protein SMAC4_09438 [Sordaria macrospora]|uniref:WGS project CABT00000000 data, contig 2.89 n=1 Tax=Sordaria macrospora (strain ATCC MYA-333 / DSM 997 / K(L3346) / K-hell) TaxID=771870 RepID=F7WBY5_SORMK|nr:uncharacterized protein SMAC_09438 [Sordaria macrospora k-hell]WPJ62632.1 hypothetical protein SMAC4_09438 [Sordaria macrospora]CCC05508.1 unnamed protein product [Sordaria macrospora k-hell]